MVLLEKNCSSEIYSVISRKGKCLFSLPIKGSFKLISKLYKVD